MTISRNAPCPCGSGSKYKHCCIDKPGVPGQRGSVRVGVLVILALGAVLGVAAGLWRGLELGFIVAGAAAVLAIAWPVIRNPPPPKANPDDPAAMNFGN